MNYFKRYDMVEIPPDVEDYDYGLKTAEERTEDKKKEDGSTSSKIEYPVDAFHMVTQVTESLKSREKISFSLQ